MDVLLYRQTASTIQTQQRAPRSACGSVGLLSKTFTPVSLLTSPVWRTDGLWTRRTDGRTAALRMEHLRREEV